MFLKVLWAVALLGFVVGQQTCENYGLSASNGFCVCPPGFGGASCELQACGGTLFQGSSRPLATIPSGSSFSNASTCSCEAGWGGFGCNVCTTHNACQTGYSSISSGSIPSSPSGVNSTIVCNNAPRVYAASEMSCDVINPTLQAIYPGSSRLNILRTLAPNSTLSQNLTSFGSAGTIHAQLFYSGVEQFFCQASNCTQSATNGTSNWDCQNLKCTCRPGTAFCGAVPTTDLTNVINSLSDTLSIDCDALSSSSTSTCSFRQSLLQNLFGAQGLTLSSCGFGECVRQGVIDTASSSTTDPTGRDAGKTLSGGVIAGIAVVAALVLGLSALLLWAWLARKKQRRNVMLSAGEDGSEKRDPIGLAWRDVSIAYPASSSSLLSKRKEKTSESAGIKRILHGISGRVEPGGMMAILGPSGAGKTSLIEVLAGIRTHQEAGVSGEVDLLWQGAEHDHLTPRMGYVNQADILPATQTVFEALLFAASLRLPENIPSSTKHARAAEVMELLGLGHLADARIGHGGAGGGRRGGLSGGERRRLSIGLEIVAGTEILILDEPTSGLDSASAYKVINLLRKLADDPIRPTTIITTIHQPSSHLYATFKSILLLSSTGHQIYHGNGGTAPLAYFTQARGVPPCPEGYSIPDWLLDLASDEELVIGDSALAPTSQSSLGDSPHLEKVHNGSSEQGVLSGRPISGLMRDGAPAASFLTQLEVLCGREWKNLLRDKSLFWMHMAVAVVLGLFCGGLYYQTGTTIAGFQSRIGCLFFLGSLLAFSSLSALFNFVEIRPLFIRERAGGYYRPSAWLLSRVLFDVVPLRLIPTIIVSTIVYWMAGLSPHADRFFKFLFILVLYALAMTLFNFLLAALFRNGGIAILISALWNLFMMTFAGFFVHLGDIPQALRWLQWFSILKYCLEALSVNEINSGLMIQDTLEGVPVNVSAQVIMQLLFGFGKNNYYRDALVLFAFIAGFAVLGLFAVIFNLKEGSRGVNLPAFKRGIRRR